MQAITLQRRAGRFAEAQALFDASIALRSDDGAGARIPWRMVEQRATLFIQALAGRPFPYRPFSSSLHGKQVVPEASATAIALEANFEAIRAEFQTLVAQQQHLQHGEMPPENEVNEHNPSNQRQAGFNGMHGRDLGLVADKDPNGWQVFELSRFVH